MWVHGRFMKRLSDLAWILKKLSWFTCLHIGLVGEMYKWKKDERYVQVMLDI